MVGQEAFARDPQMEQRRLSAWKNIQMVRVGPRGKVFVAELFFGRELTKGLAAAGPRSFEKPASATLVVVADVRSSGFSNCVYADTP